jgi:hypothetical protein
VSQYVTGSVDVTNGSATVTGNGTSWFTAGINEGDLFLVDGDEARYTVASVDTEAVLQLTAPYAGTTQTGLSYVLFIDFTPVRGLPRVSPGDLETWTVLDLVVLELDEIIGQAGATDLDGLSDVGTAAVTAGYVLVADGAQYQGRLLTRDDIPDLLPVTRADLTGVFPITLGDLTSQVQDDIAAGGSPTYDPVDDPGNYSATAFQLTGSIATAGQTRAFTATGNTRINVQSGIASSGNWSFTIKAGSTGEIRCPAGVFVDGVADRGGANPVIPLAPGFHVLRRLATTNAWEHDGPVTGALVTFHGPVGGHRIPYGGAKAVLGTADSGYLVDLTGNPSIPTDDGWQALLVASGSARTISHSSFKKASDGSAVTSPYSISNGALMAVVVRGSTCYLMGL